MGKLTTTMSQDKGRPTKLDLDHRSFVRFINLLAIIMGVTTFLFGLTVNRFQHIIRTFVNGFLVIVVANVPQGLSNVKNPTLISKNDPYMVITNVDRKTKRLG